MSGYVNVDSSRVHEWISASIFIDGKEDVDRILSYISSISDQKLIKKAMFAARSRSLQAGKALGARLAREEYTAKASKIKKRMIATITRDGEDAALRFSGFPGMNLFEFLPKPNTDTGPRPKQGVSVKVKRKGPRYVPKGKQENSSKPFIAKIYKNGSDLGIFVRYGRGQKRHMLFGPTPIQALYSWERQDKIRVRIEDTFYKRFVHEIEARLDGYVR